MTSNRSSILLLLVIPVLTLAQYQVNRQVNVGGGPQSVRFATSTQMATYQTQQSMLPSQSRMAYQQSGALPSEVRMNMAAIGPMAPSGAIAYIPPAPNYYAPRPVTAGNYMAGGAAPGMGGMAMSGPQAPQMPMSPIPMASGGYSPASPSWTTPVGGAPMTGSVRYSTPAPAASSMAPASAYQSSGVPTGQAYGYSVNGSVRYVP